MPFSMLMVNSTTFQEFVVSFNSPRLISPSRILEMQSCRIIDSSYRLPSSPLRELFSCTEDITAKSDVPLFCAKHMKDNPQFPCS